MNILSVLRRFRVESSVLMLTSTLLWSTAGYADTLYRADAGTGSFLDTALTTPASPGAILQNYAEGTGVTAGDILVFNNLITAASTFRVSATTGTNLSLGGIVVANPSGAITIQNGPGASGAPVTNTLTVGAAGIDMSNATQNLVISQDTTNGSSLQFATSADQTWTVRNQRTLTISSPVSLANNVTVSYTGGAQGGTAGSVVLGSATGGISGAGGLTIAGMFGGAASTGSGGAITLSGNNSAWTGAVSVSGGARLNLDQSAAGQNKLADAQVLTLSRGQVNLQGAGGGTETVAGVSVGRGLNLITRSAGTGVLQANTIAVANGAAVDFGNLSATAPSHVTTDNLNTAGGILGAWAVAINSASDSNWVKTAAAGADNAALALSGADYTTQNAVGSWLAGQNILVNGAVTAGAADTTAGTLKIAHSVASTGVTVDVGTGRTLTFDDGANGGGIMRNQNGATTIGSSTVASNFLTAGAADDSANDTLYIYNSQNTMMINSVVRNNNTGSGTDTLHLFVGGAGTVTLTANNTFTGGVTVGAGVLAVGVNSTASNDATLGAGDVVNNGTIVLSKTTAATAAQMTLANNISGVGAFTLNRGTATLSGNNTYQGDTTLGNAAGATTIKAGSATGFSPDSRIVMAQTGGAGIDLNGFDSSAAALRSTVNDAFVALGGNTLTLTGSNKARTGSNDLVFDLSTQIYQGGISGAGNLVKNGLYTQTFSGTGALSYTGTTTINAGALNTNKVMATSGVVINGAGTLISDVANSLAATTSMALNSAGSAWVANNGFNQSIGALTGVSDSRVNLGTNVNLTVTDNGVVPSTFAGVITGSTASFTKEGTNTLIFSGGNSYRGATTINGGVLQFAAANPVGVVSDVSAVVLADVAGVALDVNGNTATFGSLAGGGVLGGNVLLGAAGRITVGGDNSTTNFSGAIGGGAAGVEVLVKAGNGTMTLSGANTFAGDVVIRRGTGGITLAGGAAIPDTANIRNFGNGSTLTVLDSETVGSVTGAQGTNVVLGAGATLTTSYTDGAPVVRAATADTDSTGGRVIKDIDTSGLAAGMLISGTSIPAGAYIVQILDGNSVLINAVPTPTTANFAPTTISTSVLASNITGAGGFTKNGSGLLFMAGDNTYSGDTTFNEGTIQIGGIWTGSEFSVQDQLSNNSQIVFAASGTQNLNFANSATNLLQFERVGSVAGGSVTTSINLLAGSSVAALAIGGDDKSSTFSGRFLGNSSGTWLIKEGAGTFTWLNPTTDVFDGVIVLAGGGFTSGGAGGLDSANVVRFTNNGVTFTSGISDAVALIEGGAGVTRVFPNGVTGALLANSIVDAGASANIASGTILQLNSGTTTGLNAEITGAGTWQKNGSGILSVYDTSANTHTGQLIITNGTVRMAALGAATGLGAPAVNGSNGTLSTASLLRLTGGTLDLNGTDQTVAGFVASSTAGTVAIGTGSLTLSNQTTQSVGTVFTSSLNGVLNINGAGNLTLTGNSTGFGGTINVGAGQTLTLNRSGGALNSTGANSANVNLATGATLAVTLADTIGTLAGGGNVTLTQALTVNMGGAPAAGSQFSGTLSGAGAFNVTDGSLRLSGASNHTGGTSVTRGALVLDYSGGATNLLANSGALTLAGGALFSRGGTGVTDAAASTTLNAGASAVLTSPIAGTTALLDFGAIARNTGSTLQIGGAVAATSTANRASGILGGHAVYGDGWTATDWAVANGAGTAVTGLAAGSYTADAWSAGTHTNVVAGIGAAAGDTESLRFNAGAPAIVTLGGAAGIASGGILVTGAVGANATQITNGGTPGNTLTSGIADLIVHQYNPQAPLVISADITGAIGLTKAGPGTLILDQNNSFTGAVTIGQGRLQVGSGGTAGSLGAGTGAITNNGILAFSRSDVVTLSNVLQGNGWLVQQGGGTLTVGHATTASTYTGRTSVLGGSLVALRDTALGTAAGITSLASGTTLSFGDGSGALLGSNNVIEPIALKGSTLRDNTTVGAQTIFAGAVALLGTGNTISTVTAGDEARITGQIIGAADTSSSAGQQPANVIISGSGTVTLQNGANQWTGTTTIDAGATLQLGLNTAGTIGGRGDIINNGTFITNTNDGFLAIGNTISGTGSYVQTRNQVYLIGDNTFTGTTSIGSTTQNAILHIGNDTYSGGLGSGAITVQSSTAGNSQLRYHLNKDYEVANDITLLPNSDGTTARNADFVKEGLGTMTFTGTLTGGTHSTAPGTQRALITANSKLIFAGTLNSPAGSEVNLANNNVVTFAGSTSNTWNGVLSGSNVWVFRNTGTTTLSGANTFNTATYIDLGTVALAGGAASHDDNDWYVQNGAQLNILNTETIGQLYGMAGGTVNVAAGQTLTVDDAGAQMMGAMLAGAGNLTLAGGNYMNIQGATNTLSGTLTLNNGTIRSTNMTNAIGGFTTINLGSTTNAGNLEYVGGGETFAHNLNLAGTTGGARLTASGSGAWIISGSITNTGAGNKTLTLSGQTGGAVTATAIINRIDGAITEGANVLALSMPATANDDRFGPTSRWALTNAGNDFSGNIVVNVGNLELAGDLKTGVETTSVMGDLSATRTIDLGTNNYDGRRYDAFGGGDQIGATAVGQQTSTLTPTGAVGTIIFNDPNPGVATFGSNITFTQSFSSATNPGAGQIRNIGTKQIVINGNLTSGASGNRTWILDGFNTLTNTIGGIISNGTSNTVAVSKEGPGTWRLSGANTFTGGVTINRGVLEVSGGSAITDGSAVSITAAGSDGLATGGPATFRVVTSETIGTLTGNIGSIATIDAGQTLALSGGSSTMNGIITGDGRLTRSVSGGTAGTLTATAKNSYNGVTTIGATGSATASAGMTIYHLADGGVASGIGASGSAAANLVFTSNTAGNQGGVLTWAGLTNQSTDRLFTMGLGSAAARINASGTVIGTNAPTMTFGSTGAIVMTGSGARTLTLGGTTVGDNEFRPQITDAGGVTSLTKTDAGLWLLNPAVAGNTYTGTTTIAAGTLAIQAGNALGTGLVNITGGGGSVGLEIRGGITLANNVTTTVADGAVRVKSGTNVLTGTLTMTAGNTRFYVDAGASAELSNATSALTGAGTLLKAGGGTLILSGTNGAGFTGQTAVRGGTLVLDYSTNNTSKLADAAALTLGTAGGLTIPGVDDNIAGQTFLVGTSGGTLELRGGSHVEQVASTTLAQGASAVTLTSGTATINLENITRAVGSGATIDFSTASIATTNNLNGTGGILATTGGGAGTASGAYATVGKTNWAVTAGAGTDVAITALATYGADVYTAGTNTDVTLAAASTAGAATTNTLRFNVAQAATLTLGGTLSLQSAGILVTPAVGAFPTIITGGAIQNAATTANLDAVILHQHNTLGALQIDSVIQNNSGAAQVTKSGAGKVFLNAVNIQTGALNLNEGELQVGGTAAAPTVATTAALGGANVAVNISQGATLTFLSDNTALQDLSTVTGGGSIVLAVGNTMPVLMDTDNVNFFGDITIDGGTLQISGNNNVLGSNRGITTIGAAGVLQINDSRASGEFITYNQGATVTTLAAAAATLSGVQTMNNTTAAGVVFDIPAPSGAANTIGLNVSGLIYSANGFTKTGDGILQISANNFTDVIDGFTGLNRAPSLNGQILVNQGTLRVGNSRALGGTGVGNETVVAGGATVDLRDADLNFGDDSSLTREIIRIAGTGVNGIGALVNSSGTGGFSFLTLDADATVSHGGFANGSRLDLATYDTNTNNGSALNGNFTRNQPAIDGNGFTLTVQGTSGFQATVLHQPNFASPLGGIVVKEGTLRIEQDIPPNTSWAGITAANVTNGITIAYGGRSLADVTDPSLGLGPEVGARLNLYRNNGIHHTVNITMDGVTADANSGRNYLDIGTDTIVAPATYLDGTLTLLGDSSRNIIQTEAGGNYSVQEQGNLTVGLRGKLIVGGQIVGAGGFTKTGFSELRLTNNNTFTGDVSILRFGTSAAPWETNTVQINGVDYPTYGDAEGWAEWGVTLSGTNGVLSGVGNINLARRGMIALDNTTRLDLTSGVAGGNNNNRINDAATINFTDGWLRINGGTANNTEALGTLNVTGGTNIIDLYPTDGAGTNMTLTIAQINRPADGGVLRFQNLDSTSTFSTSAAGESVRVALTSTAGLTMSGGGGGSGSTNRDIAIGLLGGTIPYDLLTNDLRVLGLNNGNITDLWNQQRNLQFLAGSHFMTYDGGFLRPLDDSEYFQTTDNLLNPANGAAGQNVNITGLNTIVNGSLSINALRFGPLADNNGSGGSMIPGSNLMTIADHHSVALYVDGTLGIASGMISSAYFTLGNTSNLSTIILGGTLDFGTRQAIVNNQNGMIRSSDGVVTTGNLEIRSNIQGSGGLLKTGLAQVVLDGQNTYTGVTTISDGTLFLRHGRTAAGAGGAGNGIVITGNGNLNSGNGVQVGTPAAREDIYVGVLAGDNQVMRNDNDVTNWFSNVTIDNVDVSGQALFTPRIRTDNSATSILNGNIFGGSGFITDNAISTDSRAVQFDSSGNNVFIIRGQIGDKSDANGNAIPIPDPISTLPSQAGVRTNENEVLRVNFAGGSDETNFILERQYNAAGRLALARGTTIINYDPAAGGNDGVGFWTDTALSRIPNADSTTTSFAINGGTALQGFVFGTTSNLYNALFLAKAGQVFNMAAWSTVGSGAKFIGGLNESGAVSYGAGTGSLTISGATVQLYAASGGTVSFDQRLTGNVGTAPASLGFIKVGRGTVELKNSQLPTAGDSNFELGGGTLILNHDSQNIALVGNQNVVFSGGTLITLPNAGANTTVNLATDNAAARVLQFRLGGTEIVARSVNSGAARSVTVNLGNVNANGTTPSSNLTRALGSTVNFVEDNAAGGASQITLQFNSATTALQKNAVIPWATYGTASRTATDFAMADAGAGNDVRAFGRAADEYIDAVGSWTAGIDVSEQDGSGFTGVLAGPLSISTLRFNAPAESVVDLGTNVLTVAGTGLAQSAGAILVSSNVGSANKIITGGAGAALTTSGGTAELIFHQYSTGNLNVNVPVTGAINVTIDGPSTVDASTIGATGAVVMGAANTYTGRTIINGAVLSISDVAGLGTNPGASTANQVTLNGGTLRFTGRGYLDMGNRGFTFEGSGGTIDVVEASAALRTDSIASQSLYRGDLIKVGAGTLGIEGTNAANANFFGMIDVREGTLRLNGDFAGTTSTTAITTTLLGSSNSFVDGTIFRNGANFAVQMGNRNDASDWNIDEWLTFEGNNSITVGTINTQTGVTPGGFPNPNNERPVNLNGVITVNGTITVDVVPGQTARFNNGGSGYVTGGGDIIKDGQGQLDFRGNVPDWTGNLVIKQGRVYGLGQADVLGTGYLTGKTVTLGSAERQGIAELFMNSESSVGGWTVELNHNVNVVYNPAQTKRLAFETLGNGGRNDVNGDITLNDNLQLYINDGAEVGGSQNYVNFNGRFKDGATTSGNLLFWADDAGGANDNSNGRPVGYFVLNGDNSQWTGDAHISANTSYDQDQVAVVRLGHAQALTAANDVTMNYNSILQVGGQAATIGGLTTNGGAGPYLGGSNVMSASTNGSTEIIENAASAPGTLTITQSTPAGVEQVWDAHFRDGTLNSQFFAPGTNTTQPSASLSIVKAGGGWATLTLDNAYTGSTTVAAGVLQVGKNGIGSTGATNALGTTVLSGATLAGSGAVQGGGSISSGAFVKPGDLAGNAQGTLTFNGDVTFAAGSTTTMQVQRASYNNPGMPSNDAPAYATWLAGIATDSYSSALDDPLLATQHDKVNVLGTLTWAAGTKVTLVNNGYNPTAGDIFNLFDWFNVSGAIDAGPAIRNGTELGADLDLFDLGAGFSWDTSLFASQGVLVVVGVIPEPSRVLLLLLGIIGLGFTRRRRPAGSRGQDH